MEFNVRVWFAEQSGLPAAGIRVVKAERTTDGGWEFGVERGGQPVGAILVAPARVMPTSQATRLVVATWGADQSATGSIETDRELAWD
jgi:hypothetical protein